MSSKSDDFTIFSTDSPLALELSSTASSTFSLTHNDLSIASFKQPWTYPTQLIVVDNGGSGGGGAVVDVDPLILRYTFIDDGKDAEKAKVRANCVEWETWANVRFQEDAGLASYPAALRAPLIAAAKAKAAVNAAVATAKRAAITAAQTAGVPGAGTSLAAPRVAEQPRDINWATVDRGIAAAAETAALAAGGAAQAAKTALEQAYTALGTAYTNAGSPDDLPPVKFITFLPGNQWSYAYCGESLTSINMVINELDPMMMSLSLSDIALADNDTDAKRNELSYDRGTILHEFGHVLGFQHEHQSPGREGVLAFIANAFEKHWRSDTEKENVVGQDDVQSLLAYSTLDEDSIMMYYLPAVTTTLNREITRKHELSPLDKAYAMIMYPRPATSRSPGAPWAPHPPKYALQLIGIPEAHPAWAKIVAMYEHLGNPASNIANTEWRGVDATGGYPATHRNRNIVQTIRTTLSTWTFARGAATRARLALEAAIKAQEAAEKAYEEAEGKQSADKAQWVRVRLQALKRHQDAAERSQKRE